MSTWSWTPLPPSIAASKWRSAMLLRDGEAVGVVGFGPELAPFRRALFDDLVLALNEPDRLDVPRADLDEAR